MTPAAFPNLTALPEMPGRVLSAVMAVLPIMLDTAFKGGLLVAVGGAVAVLLHGRSAAVRYATWAAAVLAHLALPVLTLTMPGVRGPWMPLLPTPPWLTADAPPLRTVDGRPSALAAVAALWVAGALIVGLRLAAGTWQVTRLARASVPVVEGPWLPLTRQVARQLGITRPVALRSSTRVAVPMTWGVVPPVVLLPADADTWPDDQRRLVLVHEFAHIRRYDTLTQTAAQLAVALFWFDPLLWLAAWRLRVERERACDDVVLRDGAVPSRYAGALLAFARTLSADPGRERASPAVAAFAMTPRPKRHSEFARRVHAILDPARDRAVLGRRGLIAASWAAGVLTPPLAAVRPFRPPPPPPSTRHAATAARAATALRLPRTP